MSDDDNSWLNDLHVKVVKNLPGSPAEGREHRTARNQPRFKFGELRTWNAVGCWIHFVLVDLDHSEDSTSSTFVSMLGTQGRH